MFPDVSKIRLMNAEQEQVIRTGRAVAAVFSAVENGGDRSDG
jgi:hypothetical protein